MAYDHGLVERLRDSLHRLGIRNVREKNVFGGWGFLVGKSAFLIAADEGLVVKAAPDEYEPTLSLPGVTAFAPMGERPMSTWVVADSDATADDLDLAEWVQRGLRGVRASPVKHVASREAPKDSSQSAKAKSPPRKKRR